MGRTKGSRNKPSQVAVGLPMPGSITDPQAMFNIGVQKQASMQKEAGNFGTMQTSSFFYSPELTTESWLLPKTRQEIIKWARIFFNLEPYIQSIITMHANYPFSKFQITSADEKVSRFYTDMAFNEDFDLFTFILDASLSYQKYGEAIMFGNMEKGDDNLYRWKKFILLEPELVEVKTDLFSTQTVFELVPTEDLKRLVNSNRPEDMERQKTLEDKAGEVIRAVKEGRNIQLDPEMTSMIFRKTDPSATRGTSPIQPLFKVLIFQDWIRLAQSAYAQRYVFPVELWTVGSIEHNIMPDDATLEKWRNLINQAVQNPPFSIVAPPIIKYEPLSTLGKNFPINNEYEYIHDQLLVGLGVNKNIILGEGPSFSNVKTMALHKLMMMYKVVRDQFENWMIYKYFRPIAEKNNFYTMVDGKRKLILPQISWFKSLDIEEQENEKNLFIDLHEKGLLSTKTLFSKLPSLDYSSEQKKLEEEIGTVWDKGDDRLPKKISKPSTRGESSDTGGGISAIEPIEPIEPTEPSEPGGEDKVDEVEEVTPETTTVEPAEPTPETPAETPAAPTTPLP